MNEFDVFPIFERWKFPAWKIHSFRSPRSTYLSCGAERLDGFKEPGCGETSGWAKIAEGMLKGKRIPIVDLFCLFFPMFFSASCLASSCFCFSFFCCWNVWEVQVFLVNFWQGRVVWAEYFLQISFFCNVVCIFSFCRKKSCVNQQWKRKERRVD